MPNTTTDATRFPFVKLAIIPTIRLNYVRKLFDNTAGKGHIKHLKYRKAEGSKAGGVLSCGPLPTSYGLGVSAVSSPSERSTPL